MTIMARLPRSSCTIRLLSDDAILAAFLAETCPPGSGRALDVVPLRRAEARVAQSRAPDALVMDRAGFDAVEPLLPRLPADLPRILITDRIDTAVLRRLRAAGVTAAIPTHYGRALFLNALALALAGEPFLPAAVWLPCVEERLAVAGPPGEGEAGLTPRERDVLSELAAGKSNKMIAHSLGIAEPTVKMHLAHIGRKFGVANRTQLLARAIRQGILPDFAAGPGPGAAPA